MTQSDTVPMTWAGTLSVYCVTDSHTLHGFCGHFFCISISMTQSVLFLYLEVYVRAGPYRMLQCAACWNSRQPMHSRKDPCTVRMTMV